MTSRFRPFFSGLLAALCASWLGAPGLRAQEAHVILRVPAGTPVPAELPELLAAWRQSGQVAGALLLTQGQAEKEGGTAKFAAFAVLDFASEESAIAWQRNAVSKLPASIVVRRAEVLAQGELPHRPSARSVFVVNTYTPIVAPARFGAFVTGYVLPLYQAMQATGDLVRYTAYAERGEVGKVDALNLLEYRDDAAFADAAARKGAIRKQVAEAVPTYSQFDGIKDSLRIDGFGTRATFTPIR